MSQNLRNRDLTQGDIRQHLVRLSVPMIWGIMAIISFQLADTFFIGMLGTEKLAAISFTFPVTMTYFSINLGFSIAMSSVASRLIGQGQPENVRRVVTHGLLLVFLLGIIIAGAGILFHDPLFKALGAKPEMLPLIDDFMAIWFAGAALTALPMVGNAAMRAGGETMTPAKIMMGAALLNFILDPVLIFGLFGFPRLELQGAAITTVFSSALAAFAGLYILYRRDMLLTLKNMHWADFGNSCKRLLTIALPAGIANALPPITNGIIVGLLAQAGAEAVAAYGVITRVEAFAFVVLMALAVGMSPLIGQNWGAGNFARVKTTINTALVFSIIFSLVTAILLGVLGQPIASLFSDDNIVIYYTALYFVIVPVTYVFGNLVAGWGSAFNSIGKPHLAFMVIFVKSILLQAVFAFIGFHFGGVKGIYCGIASALVIAGTLTHLVGMNVLKKATA